MARKPAEPEPDGGAEDDGDPTPADLMDCLDSIDQSLQGIDQKLGALCKILAALARATGNQKNPFFGLLSKLGEIAGGD